MRTISHSTRGYGRRRLAWLAILAAFLWPLSPSGQSGVTFERVSVTFSGDEVFDGDSGARTMSADGRFALFWSRSSTLGYHPDFENVPWFVRDRQLGTTTPVPRPGPDPSWWDARLSADGAMFAGLTLQDGGAIHVLDRASLAPLWISDTLQAGNGSTLGVNGNGTLVAFNGSYAGATTPADANAFEDVFVHDRTTDVTRLVTLAADGSPANGPSRDPSISADGQWLTFVSDATNLVADDTNDAPDVFLLSLQTGARVRLGRAQDGVSPAPLSTDGAVVAFLTSDALDPADTDGLFDVYVFDRVNGTVDWVSDVVPSHNGGDLQLTGLSGNGLIVAFRGITEPSFANVLFRHDRQTNATTPVAELSVSDSYTSLTGTGCELAFTSSSAALVPNDTNAYDDAFVASQGAGCGVAPSTLSVGGSAAFEGDGAPAALPFTVTLLPASPVTVTVAYATSDGTATAGWDYTSVSGTLTFAPGETSRTVDVPILGDLALEFDETVRLTLSNPSGAVIGTATALGTIRDDDDHTPPVLTAPATIVIVTTSPAGAAVNYEVTAVDDHDPNPVLACSPESGSLFQVGTTTVSCAATDASGNTAQATFEIRVERDLPPTLVLPADITATESAPSSGGAIVGYSATAVDDRDLLPTVACAPPSGAFFGVGTTVVSCTATDSAGNQTTGTFRVTVLRAAPAFVPLTVEVVSPAVGGVSVLLEHGVNGTSSSARCFTACTWDLLLNYPTVLTVEGLTAGGPFFQRWEGCDAVNGASCYVTMTGSRLVRAVFDTTVPGLAHGACLWASFPRPGQRDMWLSGCIWEWTTGLTGGFLSMNEAGAPYWTAVAFAPSSIDWNGTSLTFDGLGITGLGIPGATTRPNGQTIRVDAAQGSRRLRDFVGVEHRDRFGELVMSASTARGALTIIR